MNRGQAMAKAKAAKKAPKKPKAPKAKAAASKKKTGVIRPPYMATSIPLTTSELVNLILDRAQEANMNDTKVYLLTEAQMQALRNL